MQGEIIVNGKKMTVTEIVEAYCELKDQKNQLEIKLKETEQEVQDYKTVVNNIKENYKNLMTRCMSGADVALSEHRFGCLTICLNSEYDKLLNAIDDLERELRVKDDLLTIKGAISERKINLNDTIKVKLTPLGADIFYHQYDKLNKNYGKTVIEPHLPKVDEKGYTKFQLHQFMELYGEHIGVTKPNVIEPLDIILCE